MGESEEMREGESEGGRVGRSESGCFLIQGPRNSMGPDIQHFILGSEGTCTCMCV